MHAAGVEPTSVNTRLPVGHHDAREKQRQGNPERQTENTRQPPPPFHGRQIPGPRQQVPWIAGTDDVPLEALASGSLYPVGQDAGALKLAPPQADGG